MLCMILVIIAAKFTLKFIFERLKYISKFSGTSCISFFFLRLNKFASIDHLNGNFNNLILKNNTKILTFLLDAGPRGNSV